MLSRTVAAMFKWQLFKHTEYDAIFFTDGELPSYLGSNVESDQCCF
jgi:hypothetical protein